MGKRTQLGVHATTSPAAQGLTCGDLSYIALCAEDARVLADERLWRTPAADGVPLTPAQAEGLRRTIHSLANTLDVLRVALSRSLSSEGGER